MTRHYRLTGAAVVGVLLLAGCSDGAPAAEASVAPTSTSSPTPSPSASPSPSATAVVVAPERPAEMDDDGQAGAEAAAVYFLELDAYMQATGDTREWSAMSHQACSFCAARLEQAKQIAANGDTYTGGVVSASVIEVYRRDDLTGIWPIDLEIAEEGSSITQPDGTVVLEVEASTYRRHVEIGRQDDRWVVVGVAAVKDD